MTTRHALLHPSTVRALLDLSDPRKSVCRPLSKGKAAGKLELIYQLFPPVGVHRNSIPASFTLVLDDWVTFQLDLMVGMVGDLDGGGDGLIFGFIAHDQWAELEAETGIDIETSQHWAAVKYNPTTREGSVYLYKEAYAVIEKLHEGSLDSVKALRRRKEETSKPPPSRTRTPVAAGPGVIRVLYAEDNVNMRETITACLDRWGYAVDVVENGHQLIGKLEVAAAMGGQYDLVITDNDMPRVTGIQALRQIRADERFKDLPVIVFTGDKGVKEAVEKAGGVYLEKGTSLEYLEEAVNKMATRTIVR